MPCARCGTVISADGDWFSLCGPCRWGKGRGDVLVAQVADEGEAVKMKIWVVELRHPKTGRFEPTTGAALTKSEARLVRQDWLDRDPDDVFRVVKYMRTPEAKP